MDGNRLFVLGNTVIPQSDIRQSEFTGIDRCPAENSELPVRDQDQVAAADFCRQKLAGVDAGGHRRLGELGESQGRPDVGDQFISAGVIEGVSVVDKDTRLIGTACAVIDLQGQGHVRAENAGGGKVLRGH